MLDLLAYDFLRHAVLAGLLASVLCGLVGTVVVVKRMVFLGGGISHAAFGGLGVCYFLGIEPRLGAGAVAVVAALALSRVRRQEVASYDSVIGVLWAAGMALGAAFVYKTPGYAPNLMTYLFGDILSVTREDVELLAGLVVAAGLFFVLLYKEVVALAFDEEFAAVQGVPVRALVTALMVLLSVSVVLLIQLVGIVLVIALLSIPPLASLMIARRFGTVMALSVVVGSVMTLGGLALSYRWDLPSGPAIVLLGGILLAAVAGARKLRRRARSPAM